MKLIKETKHDDGSRRITLELAPGEQYAVLKPDEFYQLGHPIDDVVQSHILAGARRVTWCPVGQEWVKE